MGPYIVQVHDRAGEPCSQPIFSPTSSAASTVVSFDSLDSSQVNRVLEDDIPLQPQDPSEEGSVNTSAPSLSIPSYPRHKHFFFDDGNITFLVGGILYRVHRYFFCRDSSEFKERLLRLPTEKGPSSPPVISLNDVKSADFDAFLSVLYPPNFNMSQKHSFKEWSSILDLSSRWGFTSIRDLAIRCLKPPSPYHLLLLARKYGVDEWVLPALSELCERPQPLSVDEARLMDFEDIVLIGSVRERVRSRTLTLTVKPSEVRSCIEAWKKGEPWSGVESVPAVPATAPTSRPPSAFGGTFVNVPATRPDGIFRY